MKKTSGIMLGACMVALLGSGLGMAVEGKADQKAAPEVKKVEAAANASQQALPQAQKVQIPGVALINSENADEAVLLVQMSVPGPDGSMSARMVGIPINMDDNGKQLIKEFGVVGADQKDPAAAEKTRKEAMEKFVMVRGTVKFDTGAPLLTVEKYESAKDLLAQVKKAAPAAPAAATTSAPVQEAN